MSATRPEIPHRPARRRLDGAFPVAAIRKVVSARRVRIHEVRHGNQKSAG
ncbi:MAG: hypothetical protein ACR2N0_03015 [Rubrobacteraceae bacterium]|nr:hypothetical protein [Rubrobacter sp.]